MSEVLWLLRLFQSDVLPLTKCEKIQDIWSWSGEELPDNQSLLSDKVLIGIGNPGTGYNTHFWRENRFLVNAISDFKTRNKIDRQKLISDPWSFSHWLNGIPDDGRRQLWNILPHLLFPDTFERVSTLTDKQNILAAFEGISIQDVKKWGGAQIDSRLLKLRKKLKKEHEGDIDFYEVEFTDIWKRKIDFWLLDWSLCRRRANISSTWICDQAEPRVDDQVFVVRTAQNPKGIIATGTVTQEPYEGPHFDIEQAVRGVKSHYIDVDLDELRAGEQDIIVNLADLEKQESRQQWNLEFEMIEIANKPARTLRRLWKELPPKPISPPAPSCQNLILYGPPGTGKTYRLIHHHLPHYTDDKKHRYDLVTFHQNYAYEDFVEGIRPVVHEGAVNYKVLPGVLKRICERARKEPTRRFALLIDEINRGNIAKIFGELITLVELDKRIRCDASGNRVADCTGSEVTLPYSGERFGVPINVDIIGTMNTADRSIALLDAALRRRFRFEELMPESNLLKSVPDGKDGNIDLMNLLKTLNLRLTYLLHRDRTIGHSYFLKIQNFEDLKQVFAEEILPLLQEAFYDDWELIRFVLADQTVNEGLQLVRIRNQKVEDLFPNGASSKIEDGVVYEMVHKDEITPDAIRKIYEMGTSE